MLLVSCDVWWLLQNLFAVGITQKSFICFMIVFTETEEGKITPIVRNVVSGEKNCIHSLIEKWRKNPKIFFLMKNVNHVSPAGSCYPKLMEDAHQAMHQDWALLSVQGLWWLLLAKRLLAAIGYGLIHSRGVNNRSKWRNIWFLFCKKITIDYNLSTWLGCKTKHSKLFK